MSRGDGSSAVVSAVADAGVGTGVFGTDIVTINGIQEVVVGSGGISVRVSVPVPAGPVRSGLEDAITEAVNTAFDRSVSVEWDPVAPDTGRRIEELPDVKNIICVGSGKGGVGKSTVAVNLAVALATTGVSVGVLDADIYGPNAVSLLGGHGGSLRTNQSDEIVPAESHGVRAVSMQSIVGEDDPVIWRGPIVDDVLHQFIRDVNWGALDYLVVDMPPGTGDVQMTLMQTLPVTGVVIVTTPQAVAVDDAERGLRGFDRYDVPVLGIVENMSEFECPDCGSRHAIFGEGGASALAAAHDVPVVGRVPLDSTMTDRVEPTARGVTLPVVGRVQVPRTASERSSRHIPVVIRDASSSAKAPLRDAAGIVAGRVHRTCAESVSS